MFLTNKEANTQWQYCIPVSQSHKKRSISVWQTLDLLWPNQTLPSANPWAEHRSDTSLPAANAYLSPRPSIQWAFSPSKILVYNKAWGSHVKYTQKDKREANNLKIIEAKKDKKFRKKLLNSSRNYLPPQMLLPAEQTYFPCFCDPSASVTNGHLENHVLCILNTQIGHSMWRGLITAATPVFTF